MRVANEEAEQKGMTGAVGGVLRQIPSNVIKPLILATEATVNVLGGVQSQLVPDSRREAIDKWRQDEWSIHPAAVNFIDRVSPPPPSSPLPTPPYVYSFWTCWNLKIILFVSIIFWEWRMHKLRDSVNITTLELPYFYKLAQFFFNFFCHIFIYFLIIHR